MGSDDNRRDQNSGSGLESETEPDSPDGRQTLDTAARETDADSGAQEIGLAGQLLVAMPSPAMGDPRFEQSVIFVCAHSADGAMGLIINKPSTQITFSELLKQLNIPKPESTAGSSQAPSVDILSGGPVEIGRGFVLHSSDHDCGDATLKVTDEIGLTASVEMVKALACGDGPAKALLALGYAGWGPGQVEAEIKANGWLIAPGDPDLIFAPSPLTKWHRTLDAMGIQPGLLSPVQGTA